MYNKLQREKSVNVRYINLITALKESRKDPKITIEQLAELMGRLLPKKDFNVLLKHLIEIKDFKYEED